MIRQMETIQAMVAENLGASLVPSLCIPRILKGSRALPLKPRRFRRIGLLRSANAALTPAVGAWIELCKAQIKELVKQKARR
jgi:DNA-binding transcriptional LysR family regulator